MQALYERAYKLVPHILISPVPGVKLVAYKYTATARCLKAQVSNNDRQLT
jgi:hypothetical protein